MGSIGLFLPILIISCVSGVVLFCLIDQWLLPKTFYERWLEKELKKNPGYINWLKVTNHGKDYRLGLRVLARVRRERNYICKKVFRKIIKGG